MHYRNGRLAKIGDPVVGTTYNRKGTQVGVLVGITPGADTCNCRVAVIDALPVPGYNYNRTGMIHVEPTEKDPVNLLLSPAVDYSACKELLHADDVRSATGESIPDLTAPKAAATGITTAVEGSTGEESVPAPKLSELAGQ